MTRTTIVIAAALALAVTLPAAPAQAQVARTFVSAAGSDSNNCANVATPCRHFQTAVTATAPGGEVVALDPANYGSMTINHQITINGQGWAYVGPQNGGNAITIAAGSNDNVTINGVVLDGIGATGGTNGIVFTAGASLTVTDCVVQNFTNDGILIQPSGAQTINGTIVRVRAINNQNGIYVFGELLSGGGINVAISDSVASNNSANGITFQTTSARTVGSVQNSTIANNHVGLYVGSANVAQTAGVGVQSSIITTNFEGLFTADGGTIHLSRSMLAYNTFDSQASCSSICTGKVLSTGDNGEANTVNTDFNIESYH
jgi:hypothetical protein